jgi:subtilisin family serine protease
VALAALASCLSVNAFSWGPSTESTFGAAAPPASVQLMVELEDPPTAVIYAEALGRDRDPSAKASATLAAREQLARIERRQQAVLADLEAVADGATVLFRVQRVYNGISLRFDREDLDRSALERIVEIPGVRAVHLMAPPKLMNSTSVPHIGAPTAWMSPTGATGAGVSIGVLDGGVDYIHTDFGGSGSQEDYQANDPSTIDDGLFPTAKVAGGWDFVDDDPDPFDVPGLAITGHGTHVAGTATGFGVNSDGSTYTGPWDDTTPFGELRIGPGVAPEALLYALRVTGGEADSDWVVEGIEWATDPDGDGDFSDHLDVINMSLGWHYGLQPGPWNPASDNAALAGVIVVAAAGGEGDGCYVTAAPGSATWAISAAASYDEALSYQKVSIDHPPSIAGEVLAKNLGFGASPGLGVTGEVVEADPPDACSPLVNSADLTGRIALVDWLGCPLDEKAQALEAAGAVGVLVVPDGWPEHPMGFPGGERVSIPVTMIREFDGQRIRTALPGVEATLTLLTSRFDLQDNLAPFTTRGPRMPDSLLKPDVAAPGVYVFSALAHSGSAAERGIGTSMAAPHVAGAMAVLRQLHPDWAVEELKALLMNTAAGTFNGPDQQGAGHGLTRAGAGRIDLAAAVQARAVAHATEPEGLVSASFGLVDVTGTEQRSRTVRVVNKNAESMSFELGWEQLADVPGVEISLPVQTTITIEALGEVTFEIELAGDAETMRHSCDPRAASIDPVMTFFEEGPPLPDGPMALPRPCLAEEAGFLVLTPQPPHGDHPRMRLPVHAVVRPVASMACQESEVLAVGDTDSFELHLEGEELDSGATPPDIRSRLSAFELAELSPDDPVTPPEKNHYDLHYVGVSSDYHARAAAGQSLEDTVIAFAITTHGPWSHHAPALFKVLVDPDRDGSFDMEVDRVPTLRWDQGDHWIPRDLGWSYVVESDEIRWQYPVGGLLPDEVDVNLFNSDAMVLHVRAADLGLTPGDSAFDYRVEAVVAVHEIVMDSTEIHTYDPANPGLHLTGSQLAPMYWDDLDGAVVPVAYDHEGYVNNRSQGLLLIHHHNANGERAEVVEIVQAVEEAPRRGGNRVTP